MHNYTDILAEKWSFAPGVDMACLRIVLNARIPDILAENPGGLSVQELGNRTSLDPSKLQRILRVLASKHCFRESEDTCFNFSSRNLTLSRSLALSRQRCLRQ